MRNLILISALMFGLNICAEESGEKGQLNKKIFVQKAEQSKQEEKELIDLIIYALDAKNYMLLRKAVIELERTFGADYITKYFLFYAYFPYADMNLIMDVIRLSVLTSAKEGFKMTKQKGRNIGFVWQIDMDFEVKHTILEKTFEKSKNRHDKKKNPSNEKYCKKVQKALDELEILIEQNEVGQVLRFLESHPELFDNLYVQTNYMMENGVKAAMFICNLAML